MERAVIYFVQCGAAGPIKIGYVRKDMRQRLSAMQNGNHEKLRVLACTDGDVPYERALHKRFSASRIRGEWFTPTDELLTLISKCSPGTPAPDTVNPAAQAAWAGAKIGQNMARLARQIKISRAALYTWQHVPAHQLDTVSRLTGVPRETLRPDLYSEPRSAL
jgi:hypothetical protein